MPCYSSIQTVITSLADLEKAAAEVGIGIKVIKHSATRITLERGREHITLSLNPESKKWQTVAMSGSNNWPEEIMAKVLPAYAKARVKSFAAKKGMVVSKGQGANQYVMTKY